jgi:hypothetical protein
MPRLLGRKTSLERVAALLLQMDSRLTAAGVMALPVCRCDIADSSSRWRLRRALSMLHGKGILGFLGQTQRQIVLLESAEALRIRERSASAAQQNIAVAVFSLRTP